MIHRSSFDFHKFYALILLLDKPYQRLLFSRYLTKSTFCKLANFRSFFSAMLGSGFKVKFSYEKLTGKYTISDSGHNIESYHEKLALWSYQRGIANRAKEIGQVYHLEKIKFSPGDLVIDCGANVGDLMLYFKQVCNTIEYVGVEPSPLEYECLVRNVSPMKCLNLGLWFQQGKIDFYLAGQKGDSSFIKPRHFDSMVKVDTVRLDTLFDRNVKLLKVEAEGAEPEVLLGAENLLSKIQYISADLGFERGPLGDSTLVPVLNFLLERNFELVEISHKRVVALFRNKAHA